MDNADRRLRLVRQARSGDRAAFAELINSRYRLLLGVCRRALSDRDLARDAAQEAVLVAMLGLGRLRDDTRFDAWLVGIAMNVCRAMLRSRGRESTSLTFANQESARTPRAVSADPASSADDRVVAARVRAAIASLPAGQRDAVTLFYLAGLTHTEIASELHIQPGAVKTRLHKARRSLRPALANLWKEYYEMPTQTSEFVPMTISELRRRASAGSSLSAHVLTLREQGGDRSLQIWIGQAEATALAIILEQVELPRPGAHHFTAALLRALGGQLREVRIVKLSDFTFYAQAVLGDGTAIDARPSDALNLAVLVGAPITVAVGVLEQTGPEDHDYLSGEPDARVIANETVQRLETELKQLRERGR